MLQITHSPASEPISTDFSVTLNGIPAAAVQVRVSAIPHNRLWPGQQRPLDQTELASYLSFAADEPVKVCLTASRPFQSVLIRPLSANIQPEICGNQISFTVSAPQQCTVELDGPHNAFHLFADPITDYGISPDAENVLYFGPGTHRPGQIELSDNTTVYIDRDAVVYGSILAFGAKNIRICGDGVLDGSWDERVTENFLLVYDFPRTPSQSWEWQQMQARFRGYESLFPTPPQPYIPGTGTFIYQNKEQFRKLIEIMKPVGTGLHFYACNNISVNGIIVRDCAGLSCTHAGCDNLQYQNVKLIGMWRYNSDGIDLYNCRNVQIANCFLRTFDDSICMKGQIGWDTQNTENVLVENCVIWNDWGHTLEFGADSVASEIKNIVFRNCDCIHHVSNVMSLNNTDRAYIHDVLFEDIRVEYSKYGLPPQYQHSDDEVYVAKPASAPLIYAHNTAPGTWSKDNLAGRIYDVTFKNIQVTLDEGHPLPMIYLQGLDAEHTIELSIQAPFTLNGKPVQSLEEFDLKLGTFASFHTALTD